MVVIEEEEDVVTAFGSEKLSQIPDSPVAPPSPIATPFITVLHTPGGVTNPLQSFHAPPFVLYLQLTCLAGVVSQYTSIPYQVSMDNPVAKFCQLVV